MRRDLPLNVRPREAGGFLLVGAARTLLSLCLYWALNLFLPYWLSFTVSFVLSLALSALVNSQWVFVTQLARVNVVAYGSVYLLNYCLSLGLLLALVDGTGMSATFAPFVVIPVMLPMNFLGERWALRLHNSVVEGT
jgi:putative flippase GtrA